MRKIISIQSNDEARMLFGKCDENLRLVEASFGIKTAFRGEDLAVLGKKDAAERAARFFEELQAVASVEVFPTRSNFFLCRLNMDLSLDEFIRSLLEHGIYVRDCRNFHGLNGNYFRIGIRLKEQNHLLINIIRGMC